MDDNSKSSFRFLGLCLVVGLSVMGLFIRSAVVSLKKYERTVTVKGLSEKEYIADIILWPIVYSDAGNDLGALYKSIESTAKKIETFLLSQGLTAEEVSLSLPNIEDRFAGYASEGVRFRYTGTQSITIYSEDVQKIRNILPSFSKFAARENIVLKNNAYQNRVQYLFTRLNEVKPAMIEEATQNARAVAEKFAQDSKSQLGKIKKARQGQFSISPRDDNNPHIQKVRVVSTVEYYLTD